VIGIDSCRYQAQAERIAELEARLNGLVSTLGVSHPSSISVPSSTLANSSPNSIFPENVLESRAPHDAFMPSPASSYNPGTESQHVLTKEKDPDELLDLFRTELARQVPFIVIPPHVNAKTFAQEKPFLYRAIITAASYHDSVHQMTLGQDFLKDLTEHVFLVGKKNLDMLQGLLVYITWYVHI
jgi:hypothetical protein